MIFQEESECDLNISSFLSWEDLKDKVFHKKKVHLDMDSSCKMNNIRIAVFSGEEFTGAHT